MRQHAFLLVVVMLMAQPAIGQVAPAADYHPKSGLNGSCMAQTRRSVTISARARGGLPFAGWHSRRGSLRRLRETLRRTFVETRDARLGADVSQS